MDQTDKPGQDLNLPQPTLPGGAQPDSANTNKDQALSPVPATGNLPAITPPANQPLAPVTPVANQPPPQTPSSAADTDLIEKEWVDKAKEIVDKTRTDPYLQTKQINQMKAD